MKSSILTGLLVLLGIFVAVTLIYAETEQVVAGSPSIAQPLVREGTVALKLVDALKLGPVSNEAEAESALGGIGIAPKNGWIADYPVTPDIVSELQSAVLDASDSKRIVMGRDEVFKAFQKVMSAYDLAVRPSAAGEAVGNVPGPDRPDQTVINNYYYDEGPPVVTYYAPPWDYAYLYTWVPYPFWWWDFWFPGFFVLADFDIHVHGHRHFHDGHFGDRDGDHFSNHFRDSRTGAMSRIDPANRANGSSPVTGVRGWASPSAQRGAQAIFNRRTGNTVTSGNAVTLGRNRSTASPSMNSWSGRTGSTTTFRNSTSGSRNWNAPSNTSQNTYSNSYYGARTYTPSSTGNITSDATQSSTYAGASVSHAFQSRSSGGSFGGWHSSGISRGSLGGSWRK